MDLQRLILQSLGSVIDNNSSNGEFDYSSLLTNKQTLAHVMEDRENIILYIDIPGVDTSSIDVNFYNNKISITGTRKQPSETDSYTEIKNEVYYGDIKKNITIPISVVNRDSVSVKVENGVMKIVISKINEEKNIFNIRVSS